MNTKLVYILIVSLVNALTITSIDHDIKIAKFIFSVGSDSNLSISIDQQDIQEAIRLDQLGLDLASDFFEDKQLMTSLVEKYLQGHLNLLLNKQRVKLKLTDLKEDEEHYRLKFDFSIAIEHITSFNLTNTTLLNYIPSHSNIITVHYDGIKRDFHMNKNRTEIEISY